MILFGFLACQAEFTALDQEQYLQPEFWKSLSHSKACRDLSFYAWNEEGTIGLEVTVPPVVFPKRSGEQRLDVREKDVVVLSETGKRIPVNFCVHQIKEIPVAHVYESISGFVTVDFELQNQKLVSASAKLENIVLQEERSGKQLRIERLEFSRLAIEERK